MRVYPLHCCIEIFFIQFARRQVKAVVVAGNGNGAGTQVGVKNFVARFGVVMEQPFVKRDGFLGWVDVCK